MAYFRAIMTYGQSFGILRLLRWCREFKTWMHELAGAPFRAESCKVVDAENTTNMSVSAMRTMPAETTVIPGNYKKSHLHIMLV